jgi:hypothetical protein
MELSANRTARQRVPAKKRISLVTHQPRGASPRFELLAPTGRYRVPADDVSRSPAPKGAKACSHGRQPVETYISPLNHITNR